MESVGFSGNHCTRSVKVMPNEQGQDDGCARDPASQVLPFSCMSTLCLLQSLVRWKAMTPHKGGFRKEDAKDAAVCFLAGLLSSSYGYEWTVDIVLAQRWELYWPGKGPVMKPDLSLKVVQGMICLEPWCQLAAQLGNQSLAKKWLVECQRASPGSPGSADVVAVLLRTCSDISCDSLYKQLLWACSVKVEVAIVQSLKSGDRFHDIQATHCDIMGLLSNPSRLCHELWRYSEASRRASEGCVTFSVATDKAHVTALPLSNTLVTLPSTAFVCAPQASFTPLHPFLFSLFVSLAACSSNHI